MTTKKHSRFAQEKLARILINGEERGTDACGVAFNLGKGRYDFIKAPKSASKFVYSKKYRDLMKVANPSIAIGHNRLETQGTYKKNVNNHPIITKTGLSLIHNGTIFNDITLAEEYQLKMDGEVDSEIIVKMIEYYIYVRGFDTTKSIRLACQKIRGNMACALLNAAEPQTIYLWTSTNPLNLAYHTPTKTIFFASTQEILEKGLSENRYYHQGLFCQKRGQKDYVFEELDDNIGIKLTRYGWIEFEIPRPEFGQSDKSWNTTTNKYEEKEDIPAWKRRRTFSRGSSQKPLEIESKSNKVILKALRDEIDFELFEPIKKPSRYLTEFLLYRLEFIQDGLASGNYKFTDKQIREEFTLRGEIIRIIHTITQRQKQTKRKGIYIPTFKEIWKLKDIKIKENGEYKKIKWVLSEKNKKLFDRLAKAGFEPSEQEEFEKEMEEEAKEDIRLLSR